MKKPLLLTFIVLIQCVFIFAQHSNCIGYQYDLGSKSNFNIGTDYYQHIESVQHNFFVQFYKKEGKVSNQWIIASRYDDIHFENNAEYMPIGDGKTDRFNTSDQIIRSALKTGFLRQRHWGKDYNLLKFTFNYGLYYEITARAKRISPVMEQTYYLDDELNKSSIIFSTGAEVRYKFITLGCKGEKWFSDVINHKYINSLPKSPYNSSAMQGLRLDSWMPFIYLGVKFDF